MAASWIGNNAGTTSIPAAAISPTAPSSDANATFAICSATGLPAASTAPGPRPISTTTAEGAVALAHVCDLWDEIWVDEYDPEVEGWKGEVDSFIEEGENLLVFPSAEVRELGIDRICVNNMGGLKYFLSLEYKIDRMACKTGNLFIETQRRSARGVIKEGWLRQAIAQTVVFYMPGSGKMAMVDTNDLREWIFLYGMSLQHSRWLENKNGSAIRGIVLPLHIARANLRTWIDIDMRGR